MRTSPSRKRRPNVLLLFTDQWRGDCLSIDGHPVVHTPWLDQLALGGARFSRAYSAVPSCIAARAGLYTGLTQRSHGRVGYRDGVPWRYPVTLAGEFSRQGYDTVAIGKMHVYPERAKMGFKKVILHDGHLHFARRNHARKLAEVDDYIPWLEKQLGRKADYFEHGINCNSNVARPWDKAEYLHPTTWLVTQAIDYLSRRDSRKPFFMFASWHRPHPPYDPPAWAFEQYMDMDMPQVPVGEWAHPERLKALTGQNFDGTDGALHAARPDTSWGKVRPDILRRARAGYYGHISHIDHQINRLLEALADFGFLENTYVCFSSDHGEQLGDHYFFRKSMPYEGSARVPLILAGPRDSGIAANSRISAPVELRDIMPTLLECAGLRVPSSVEGRSLLPLAKGGGGSPEGGPPREYLHGEHVAFGNGVHWITDGKEKYVWFSRTGAEQLFDLVSDPNERRDLASTPGAKQRIERWRTALASELAGREEGFVENGALVAGRPLTQILRSVKGGKGA